MCQNCWNDGCKKNEELRKSKVDVCKHMHEHPEEWEEWENQSFDDEE